MSDTSAFIAGCATTGAAALMLLLARVSMSETATNVDSWESSAAQESIVPVPAPPPPGSPNTDLTEEKFATELEDQQAVIERLESMLSQQKTLITDLEAQLANQQQETQVLHNRLTTFESSVTTLTTQQQQLVGVQHETDKAQSSLLWVGAGLVMVVLIGGALVLVILVLLVAFQSRNRTSPSSNIVYPPEVPVPPTPYTYYQQELLPSPTRPRRVYSQDIYDRD